MLSLINSARTLQLSLATGYSTLLGLWISFRGWVSTAADRDSLAGDFRSLFEELGSGFKVATLTFVAALIGGLLHRLLVKRLVGWLFFMRDAWDSSIRRQRELVERKEKEETPTSTTLAGLQHGLAELERARTDVQFRYHLVAVVIFPSLAAAVAGRGWWFLALVAPLPWLIDGVLITSEALKKKELLGIQRKGLEKALWADLVAGKGGKEAKRLLQLHRRAFPIRSRIRPLDNSSFTKRAKDKQALHALQTELRRIGGKAPKGSEAVGGEYRFRADEPRISALRTVCENHPSAKQTLEDALSSKGFINDEDLRSVEDVLRS